MKKIASLTVLLLLVVFAQAEGKRMFLTGNIGFKSDIVTYDNTHSIKTIDCSLGYKFKNKISLGFVLESLYFLDIKNKSYDNHALPGIGVKYLIYELERNKDKRYSFEPYVNVFMSSSMDAFSAYDLGVNFVSVKKSNAYVGTGIKHYFYGDGNSKNIISWYFSFGIRI